MTEAIPWYARWFDSIYLELYAHRDAEEAERATARLLEPLGLAGRRVLDLACGPGRWSHALARRHAAVVGLDLSETLLRAAQRIPAAESPAFVRGDMLELPFRSASFDLVVCMFTSFGYFATAADDLRALHEVARVVRPHGELVLDLLNAARVRREVAPVTQRRAGRWEVREVRRIDAAGDRVIKEIELRSGAERHAYREEVRLWDAAPLAMALADAGFEACDTWGDYAGGSFEPETSPRLVLHVRRRGPA